MKKKTLHESTAVAENPRMRAPSSSPPLTEPPQASHWLMGRDGAQRKAIKRLLYTVGPYVVANGLLWLSLRLGMIEPWHWALQSSYHAVGLLLFYAGLRTGRTLAWPDPSLSFAQVLFAISAIVLAYALCSQTRGAALQLLCLALVFDMPRLQARQFRLAAIGAVMLLALTLLLSHLFFPDTVNIRRELLTILMAAVQLPVIALIAREVRRMHARQHQQQVELKRAVQQLHDLSIRDGLTGIYNRLHMQNVLQEEAKRQRRSHLAFCVAILDIDFFKKVNDQHGHAVGDEVLRAFAAIARDTTSPGNTVCRWGGEEFLLMAPESDLAQAMALLAALQDSVRAHDWTRYAPDLAVRFSAGVTMHVLDEALPSTLERADQGLYAAKAQGRDRCVAMEATS